MLISKYKRKHRAGVGLNQHRWIGKIERVLRRADSRFTTATAKQMLKPIGAAILSAPLLFSMDVDDDNDGILDTEEGFRLQELVNAEFSDNVLPANSLQTFQTPTGFFSYQFDHSNVPGWSTTASDQRIEIWESGHTNVTAQSGGHFAEMIATEAGAILYQDVSVQEGDYLEYSVWHRGRHGIDEGGILIGPPGAEVQQQLMSTGNAAWEEYTGTYTVSAGITTLRFGFSSISSSSPSPAAGNFLDNLQITIQRDSDGDGIFDHLDIDSDNDGITDNVESMATVSYSVPSGIDANTDGLDDIYDNRSVGGVLNTAAAAATQADVTTPVDTDSDGRSDYLDTDSDNDATSDAEEAGHGFTLADIETDATAGNDADSDGLMDSIDVVDNTVAWNVFDDDVDGLGEQTLTDTDADLDADRLNAVALDIDFDFREATDTDADNVHDTVDIDDDNDGIPDTVESTLSFIPGDLTSLNAIFGNCGGRFYLFSSSGRPPHTAVVYK